jgi:ribosome maturation factor RimP
VREKLIGLLEPVVEGLGYELVELEFHAAGRNSVLRLYIDRLPGTPPAAELREGESQGGIGVDDCETVSRQVSALLDVEDPIPSEYALEVSSPGLDRPLRKPGHYERFKGQRARLELGVPQDGRRRYTGTLLGFTDGVVGIEVDGVDHHLPFSAIERARLTG